MIWNDFCQLLLHQYSLGNIQNQSDTIPKPFGQTLSNHISAWDRNGTPQKTPELIWLSSKYSYWMLLTNWILRWLDYVWACLKGFWMVSDWSWMFTRLYLWNNSCLGLSGYCLGWGGVGVWREIYLHKSNKGIRLNFSRLVPSLPDALECLRVVSKSV